MNNQQAREHLSLLFYKATRGEISWQVYFDTKDYYEGVGYDLSYESDTWKFFFLVIGVFLALSVCAYLIDVIAF